MKTLFMCLLLLSMLLSSCGDKAVQDEKPQGKEQTKLEDDKNPVKLRISIEGKGRFDISKMKIRFRFENRDSKEHYFLFFIDLCDALNDSRGYLRGENSKEVKTLISEMMRSPFIVKRPTLKKVVRIRSQGAYEIVIPLSAYYIPSGHNAPEGNMRLYKKKGKHTLWFVWEHREGEIQSIENVKLWTGKVTSNKITIDLK